MGEGRESGGGLLYLCLEHGLGVRAALLRRDALLAGVGVAALEPHQLQLMRAQERGAVRSRCSSSSGQRAAGSGQRAELGKQEQGIASGLSPGRR